MEVQYTTAEIWVMVDETGDYVVGLSQEDATEAFRSNLDTTGPIRAVKITAKIPMPTVLEASVAVPDDAGEIVTAEAE